MSELAPVVVCLLPSSVMLGSRIAEALGARLDLRGRDFDDLAPHLRALFLAGHPVVGNNNADIMTGKCV